jgi:hypothetical protein
VSEDQPPESYDFQLRGGLPALEDACSKYWRSSFDLISKIEKEADERAFRNRLIEVKALAIAFAKKIFDETALQIIWSAADNCEVLHLVTNLIEVPWEALVNPWAEDGRQFLAQKCSVIRKARLNVPRRAVAAEHPAPPSELLVLVDEELEKKWVGDETTELFPDLYAEFQKCRRVTGLNCVDEIGAFFEAVNRSRLVALICENAHDEEDRLRLCKGVYLTAPIIEATSIGRDAVLFIFTCKNAREERSKTDTDQSLSLPAYIASINGCTVVAPMMQISELVGVRLLRKLMLFLIWRLRRGSRRGTKVLLVDELRHLREGDIFGEPSLVGILSLYFGIYGQPSAQLS